MEAEERVGETSKPIVITREQVDWIQHAQGNCGSACRICCAKLRQPKRRRYEEAVEGYLL